MNSVRRYLFRSLVAVVAYLSLSNPAFPIDPIRLYGEEIVFDVLRKGEKVGSHVVRFGRFDDGVSVHASLKIAVRFLGFSLYDFKYDSRSTWRGPRMLELDVNVDDNGSVRNISASASGDNLKVTSPGAEFVAPAQLLPTDHWNPLVLSSSRVLNTITGRLNRVSIDYVGEDLVDTEQGPRLARHYRYTGELETEVWYDLEGRWIKMAFVTKDGSRIEYFCRRCGDGAVG